jgi:hypothetical protein
MPTCRPVSIKITRRGRNEDARQYQGRSKGDDERLREDRVLYRFESRLFDIHFLVENFPDDVAPLISLDPGLERKLTCIVTIGNRGTYFVLIAIASGRSIEGFHGGILHLAAPPVVLVSPQLPRPEMASMSSMQDDAHPLRSRKQCCTANHPPNCSHYPPSFSGTPKSDDDRCYQPKEDAEYAQPDCKYLSRFVSIADGPSDKVWVRLEAQQVFDV